MGFPKDEEAVDTDDQGNDAGGKKESLQPVPNQGKEKNVDKGDKSLDVEELTKKNGENDIEVTKAPGDQALKKDNGDEANKSSDIKENVENDDQGSKSEQNND